MRKRLTRKWIFLWIGILTLVLITGFGFLLMLHFHWNIPSSMQIQRFVNYDYYKGNHFAMGEPAGLYEITIEGYVSHDDHALCTVYQYTTEVNGEKVQATLTYPGTPKRQFYGFPRLRKGKTYILITGDENVAKGKQVKLPYYLFYVQNIDGTEYAYPLVCDTSMVSLTMLGTCENFRYVDESRIYDTWYDADVCDYLAISGRTNPEWSYKISVEALRNTYIFLLRR